MKQLFQYMLLFCCAGLFGCKKTIDLYPPSNLNTETYYSNLEEVKAGLTGAYNGLQRALFNEWQVTELRSDNAKQGQPGSTASGNRDLSDLDMFIPATTHAGNYNYWLAQYSNIRNANIIIQKLDVFIHELDVVGSCLKWFMLLNVGLRLLDADGNSVHFALL